MSTSITPGCKRCAVAGTSYDVVTNHAASDPLVVSECGTCGSILSIGPHPW